MEINFYEILNIEKRLLPYFLNVESSEDVSQMRDEIIKEAYQKQKEMLKQKYESNIKKIEEEKNFRVETKKIIIGKKRTPEKVKEKNLRGIDKDLENYRIKYEQLTKEYQVELRKIDLAFETLKSEELRKNYNTNMNEVEKVSTEQMRQITKEINEKVRCKRVEDTYSKVDQYNPELIKKIKEGRAKGERLVVLKTSKDSTAINLNDNRNITIKQTGTVLFANSMGIESYVNEYQIKRFVNGELKIDAVYTILDLFKLGFNRKKEKTYNKEYYDCVIDELLSEEAIEGSKYNSGYIGLIERCREGYISTLKRDKLNDEEKENLAAVMILGERKSRNDKQIRDNLDKKGEDR